MAIRTNRAKRAPKKTISFRSETDISRDILEALRIAFCAPGAWWERCNTGTARMRGSHVKVGLGEGTADIIGCFQMSRSGPGIMIGVEVKKPGEKQNENQLLWQARHVAAGGIYVVATNTQEAINVVQQAIDDAARRMAT